jgi:hypothetical protein
MHKQGTSRLSDHPGRFHPHSSLLLLPGRHVPGFGGDLWVRCSLWIDDGPPSIDLQTPANDGDYRCDFDDVGWDLTSGVTLAIYYFEPDNDAVIYSAYLEEYLTFLPLVQK